MTTLVQRTGRRLPGPRSAAGPDRRAAAAPAAPGTAGAQSGLRPPPMGTLYTGAARC